MILFGLPESTWKTPAMPRFAASTFAIAPNVGSKRFHHPSHRETGFKVGAHFGPVVASALAAVAISTSPRQATA